jgi:hypothetical protein
MAKISIQERDAAIRRYNELTFSKAKEIIAEILEEIKEAEKDYFSDHQRAAVDKALDAIKRGVEYDTECCALEHTLESLAEENGDARAIHILTNDTVKELREMRASWIVDILQRRKEIEASKIYKQRIGDF